MTPEDISYYQELAYHAIVSGDSSMGVHAHALQRYLKKRRELISTSRIAKIDKDIGDESRQIERWRTPSPCPELLAVLVEKRLKRLC